MEGYVAEKLEYIYPDSSYEAISKYCRNICIKRLDNRAKEEFL